MPCICINGLKIDIPSTCQIVGVWYLLNQNLHQNWYKFIRCFVEHVMHVIVNSENLNLYYKCNVYW